MLALRHCVYRSSPCVSVRKVIADTVDKVKVILEDREEEDEMVVMETRDNDEEEDIADAIETTDDEGDVVNPGTEDDKSDVIAPETKDGEDEDNRLVEMYVELRVSIIVVKLPVVGESVVRVAFGKKQPILPY
jgi:hypothetical protein